MTTFTAVTEITFPNETTRTGCLIFQAASIEDAHARIGDLQEHHRYRRRFPIDAVYGTWLIAEVDDAAAVPSGAEEASQSD